jgi:hypothetical protein
MSNERLFSVAEQLVNDNKGLIIHDVTGGSYNPQITLMNTKAKGFAEISDDEVFNFGIALGNTGGLTKLGDFAYRQVCGNGMMGMKTDWNYQLTGVDSSSVYDFFAHIDEYASNGFMPVEFAENLAIASKTNASLAEVENAYNVAAACIDEQEDSMKEVYEKNMRDKWFHGINNAKDKLKKAGINYTSLSQEEKKYVNSGQPMWDVINSLTNLGSNKNPIPLKNQIKMSKTGGQIFTKKFDLEHANLLSL